MDGVVAGSGETYEWSNLKPPKGVSRKGWLLAGGLDPTNVKEAIAVCAPTGVDVASGVADASGYRKTRTRWRRLVANARAAKSE